MFLPLVGDPEEKCAKVRYWVENILEDTTCGSTMHVVGLFAVSVVAAVVPIESLKDRLLHVDFVSLINQCFCGENCSYMIYYRMIHFELVIDRR